MGEARVASLSAIGGGVIALASVLLFAAAFGFRLGAVAPDLTTVPASHAGLLRWGALTDMVGFYLASVPVALWLGRRPHSGHDEATAVATTAGIIYAVVGSVGAVTVATVVPPLLGSDSAAAAGTLELVRRMVFVGLWQTLATIPWGVWLVVVGRRLRPRSPWLGGTALGIGIAALTTAVARVVDLEPVAIVAVSSAIVAFPVWLVAVGLRLRSGPL